MAVFICFSFAFIFLVSSVCGQASYGTGCGVALEDIPNPASDTCTAFFRCYRSRQYSIRCPLGQAFDFDKARCRPEREVDCPLQLQRFQAPAVPSHLRPPGQQNQQEREIEIRVVQVPSGIDPTTLQIGGNTGRLPPANNNRLFTNQIPPSLLSTHTRTGFVQQQQQPPFNFGVQGQIQGQVQGQYIPSQAQIAPGQYPQPLPPQPQTQAQAAVPPGQYPQPLPPQPQTQAQAAVPPGQYPQPLPQQAQAPVSKPLPVSAPEGQPGQDGLNILVPNQSQPQEPAQ